MDVLYIKRVKGMVWREQFVVYKESERVHTRRPPGGVYELGYPLASDKGGYYYRSMAPHCASAGGDSLAASTRAF